MLRLWASASVLTVLTLTSCGVPRQGLGGDGATGCMRNSDCEDTLRCTADRCQAGRCVTEARDDLCVDAPGGLCLPADPEADVNGCVYRACDDATCLETQRDPTVCEVGRCEGDLCVGTSTCAPGEVCCGDGTCMACDDGNPCTEDTCSAGACVHTPREGVLCNDGDACTVNDICTADGSCAGTTCSELGATLRCDPGRGCVGCLGDADCPDSQTPWSPCEYGGAIGDPATCAGTQSRTVTTGTCSMDMCVFTETTETRNCARARGSDVRCDSDSTTSWSVCGYTDTCDEDATQTRTRTIWRCDGATCASQMLPESRGCSRSTTGLSCGADILGDWSSCSYDNECAESGSRTRSITEQVCGGGTCGTRDGGIETDTAGCARSRDGMTCGGGTTCDPWSACDYADVCDEDATQTRTCTDRVCGGDMCNATPRVETRPCSRDTDGTSCGAPGPWSGCVQSGATSCTGSETRSVPQCDSGSCASTTESQPCNVPLGTSCGTATTGDWSACVASAGNPCQGTRTRMVTTPTYDGSGTCQNVMTMETENCALPTGTSCGAVRMDPSGPCVQTGMSCMGMRNTEIVTPECDGMGSCVEQKTPGSPVACTMPDGTVCDDGSGGMMSMGTCTGGSCG